MTLRMNRSLPASLATVLTLAFLLSAGNLGWAQSSSDKATDKPAANASDAGKPGPERRRPMMGGPGNPPAKEWRDNNADIPDLSPEQTQVVLDVLKENMPTVGERLAEALKSNPGAVRDVIREHPRLLELARLKRNDPKQFELRIAELKLEKQSRDLMLQYRKAQKANDQASLDATRAELLKAVEEHFKLRQEIREQELAKLEQRLAQVKSQIESRRSNKDLLIQQRLRELTEDGEKAEW